MTFADMLCYLRQRLVNAIASKDRGELLDLKITFGLMVEASYTVPNNHVADVLVALEDATRDAIGNVSWKSDFPSEQTIRAACDSTPK